MVGFSCCGRVVRLGSAIWARDIGMSSRIGGRDERRMFDVIVECHRSMVEKTARLGFEGFTLLAHLTLQQMCIRGT